MAAAGDEAHVARPAAIGIDLGASFCCVAALKGTTFDVVANDQGNRAMPAAVALTGAWRCAAARQLASARPCVCCCCCHARC
jgi:molecular chaperone DnaK (HSP70)